ncbi:MAG: hypothetical protein JO337_07260 [Acidimicrobiales bacterium]|nr:hypothetical protein [Acidimicrobiales bacterium]
MTASTLSIAAAEGLAGRPVPVEQAVSQSHTRGVLGSRLVQPFGLRSGLEV